MTAKLALQILFLFAFMLLLAASVDGIWNILSPID